MSRTHQGRRTREEILSSAIRLFAQQGYYHTSMSDILEAVSVSKGAFYHHFQSKLDLALAALDQMRHDYQHEFIEPIRRDRSQGDRYSEALRRLVQLNTSGRWHHCTLLARLVQETAFHAEPLAEQVRLIMDMLIDFWRECIIEDQASGVIRSDINPQRTAELTAAMIQGKLPWKALSEQSEDLQSIADQLVALVKK
jgi:AcrR family transcriptional regulator